MKTSNAALIQRDLSVLWHPCTQMKDCESLPPIPIKRGEGVWLEDFEGNRYIDAVSSWWVNLFGHANPRVNAGYPRSAGEARARDPGGLQPRTRGGAE